MRLRTGALALLGCVYVATLAACSGGRLQEDELRRVREFTYPPDFQYITRQEIRTTMGRLAAEMAGLEAIMDEPGGPAPEDRAAIVAHLERMEELAGQLKRRPRSNHPRIEADAPRLRADIQRALLAAKTAAPSYYDTGLVVGACMYCHASRDGASRDPSWVAPDSHDDPSPNRENLP